MSNSQLAASPAVAAGGLAVTSTKNTIKSPKTNMQGMQINKHAAQLAYQPQRPHSQNKDTMPKNARAAQHDSSHMNKEQEMNYNMNA